MNWFRRNWEGMAIALFVGAMYTVVILNEKQYQSTHSPNSRNTRQVVPDTSVESGYLLPSKLELLTADENKNGKQEFLMKYDGVNYRMKWNSRLNTPEVVSMQDTVVPPVGVYRQTIVN